MPLNVSETNHALAIGAGGTRKLDIYKEFTVNRLRDRNHPQYFALFHSIPLTNRILLFSLISGRGIAQAGIVFAYHAPIEYEQVYREDTNRTVREASTTRTARPPKNAAAGAAHSIVAADPKPLSFPAPPSDQMEGGTEKLESDKR